MERKNFKPRNYATEIINLITEANEVFNNATSELQRLDCEFSDLSHAFELLKMNAADMAKTGSEMKHNRINRRNCKEDIERLKCLVSWSEDNKIVIKNLKAVASLIDKNISHQKERMYTPRVRTDLTKRFREDLRDDR